MRTAPPPDNLPIDGEREPKEADLYGITPADVIRLRAALVEDLGHDGNWSDAEIRSMARDTLHLLSVVRRIANAQRRRATTAMPGGSTR